MNWFKNLFGLPTVATAEPDCAHCIHNRCNGVCLGRTEDDEDDSYEDEYDDDDCWYDEDEWDDDWLEDDEDDDWDDEDDDWDDEDEVTDDEWEFVSY